MGIAQYVDLALRAIAVAGTGMGVVSFSKGSGVLSPITAHVLVTIVTITGFVISWSTGKTNGYSYAISHLLGKWGELIVRAEVLLVTAIALAGWCGGSSESNHRVYIIFIYTLATIVPVIAQAHWYPC